MPPDWAGRDSAARAIARTIHVLVETPSRSAAFSTVSLRLSDRRKLIRADSSSPIAPAPSPVCLDVDELGLLSCEADLDVAGGQLGGELDGRLREQVEQLEPEARADRVGEASRDLLDAFVAELGEVLEVVLDAVQAEWSDSS